MNSLSSKPLAKKYFYVDLKGYLNEKKLIKDLELLGAKQEVFLSKNVSFVVSNRISLADYGNSPTPLTNPFSKSPYFFKDSVDSPASNSPNVETRLAVESQVPLSRGLSVLQKAREKHQGSNKFILDICKQWNIKVYPIQKVLSWIDKYKAKYCKNATSKPKRGLISENVTQLFSPVIKIEDKYKLYKPRYKMFSTWPEKINTVVLQCVKRLVTNYKQSGNLDYSPRLPLKEIGTKSQNSIRTTKSASITQGYECTTSKATPYNSSKLTGFNSIVNSVSVAGPPVKQKEKEHKFVKPKKEKQAKKRKLYCEICGVHYSDGEAHYEKKVHAKYLNNSANYDVVMKEIDGLPTLENFLKSLQAENGECEEKAVVSENDNSEPSSFDIEALDNFPKTNEMKLDSCLTEVYSVKEDEIISASCSSGNSSLPFLETNDKDLSKDPDIKLQLDLLFSTRQELSDSYPNLEPPPLLPTLNDVSDHNVHGDAKNNLEMDAPLLIPITNKVNDHDIPEDSKNGFEMDASLLLPITNEVYNHISLESAVQNHYEVLPDNFSVCNEFEGNIDSNAENYLMTPMDLSQNYLLNAIPDQENKNMAEDEFIKPSDYVSNFPENDICVPNFDTTALSVQEQDWETSNTCSTKVDVPLDLSCFKMNADETNLKYNLIILNNTSVGSVDDIETLNNPFSFKSDQNETSKKISLTDDSNNVDCCNAVDFESGDEDSGSESNFAGLNSVINNCLEQVTKSLLKDDTTVKEEHSKSDLISKKPNVENSSELLKIVCCVEGKNVDKASGLECSIFTENIPDELGENAFLNKQTIDEDVELCISDIVSKIAEMETISLKVDIKDTPLKISLPEEQSSRTSSPSSNDKIENKIAENECCSNIESVHQNLNDDETCVKIAVEEEEKDDEKSVHSHILTPLPIDRINVHSEKYSNPNLPIKLNNSDADSAFSAAVNNTAAQSNQLLMSTTHLISPLSPPSLLCNKLSVCETLEKNSLLVSNCPIIINDSLNQTDALSSTAKSSLVVNANVDVNTSEKYDVLKISNSVLNSMPADLSEEVLISDDAYIVLDEADSSFKSVNKGENSYQSNVHENFTKINEIPKNIHDEENVCEDIIDGVCSDVTGEGFHPGILNTAISSIIDSEKYGEAYPVTVNYNEALTADLINASKSQVKEVETVNNNDNNKDFAVFNEIEKNNLTENSDIAEKCNETKTANTDNSQGSTKLACDVRIVINASDIQEAESVLHKKSGDRSENKDETSNVTECSATEGNKIFVCEECFHDKKKKDTLGFGKRKYLNDNISNTLQETGTENDISHKKRKLSLDDCDPISISDCDVIKKDTSGTGKRKLSTDSCNDTSQETNTVNEKSPCKMRKLSLNDCDTISISNFEHPLNSTFLNAASDDIDLEDPLTANAASINLQACFFKTKFSNFDVLSISSKNSSSNCNSPSCESFSSSNEVNSSFSDILPNNFPLTNSCSKDLNNRDESLHIVYIKPSIAPNNSIALS